MPEAVLEISVTVASKEEKGMANHFSILALRTPWTVWNGKKIGHWKMLIYVIWKKNGTDVLIYKTEIESQT